MDTLAGKGNARQAQRPFIVFLRAASFQLDNERFQVLGNNDSGAG